MQDLIEFLNKYDVKFTVAGDTIVADRINLSCNEITHLPESIGNIKCNNLRLTFNQITELPESIGNIKCNWLNLNNNKITELPESFGNLKCTRVNLSYNEITHLPESIGNLKCNYLRLTYNQITELPESIGNLKCNYLSLNNNKITHFPESFGNLKCNWLNLSNNEITHLPESFGNIKCNQLSLSNNQIKYIPRVQRFDPIEITDEYIYCDGILTWYKSKKNTVDGYDVYKGYYNNYVVSDGEHFAHGKSIRECIGDIHFKKSDRDTSKYKGLSLDTKMDLNEAITMYRTITGACSGGVESFLNTQNVKNDYSIKEIITLTENQFGHKTFKTFFD